MEKQDIAKQFEASLKNKLITSFLEEVRPLLSEVLKFSRHPTMGDAVLELSRSELLFLVLLQALRTNNTAMSRRLLLEVDEWMVLPRLSYYLEYKLQVEFNFPKEFFSRAAEFAHTLLNCRLYAVPEKMILFLDHLSEVVVKQNLQEDGNESRCESKKQTKRRKSEKKSSKQVKQTANLDSSSSSILKKTSVDTKKANSSKEVEVATEMLWTAVLRNDFTAARTALENLACIDSKYGGLTPLHWAAYYGYVELIGVLVCSGADLEAVDKDGECALHIAARYANDGAVAILVAAGANLHASGSGGRTPLQRALRWNNHTTVKLLQSLGALR